MNDFINTCARGKLVYVLFRDDEEGRRRFDEIARPATDHGENHDGSHVLSKTVEQDEVRVIFQFWVSYARPARAGGLA